MSGIEAPSKVALDAETDQAFAWFREIGGNLTGTTGEFYREMASGVAAQMTAQFPGLEIGRVVMAVAQALKGLEAALNEKGIDSHPDVLLSVAGLAAEQLEREQS